MWTQADPEVGTLPIKEQAASSPQFNLDMQVASEKRRQQQEAQDANLLQCVMDGLSYTTGPTAAVRETLSREKRTRADKRAALHAAWTAGVYDKIQGRLQTAVNALSDDDIQARLRRNMQVRVHAKGSL